MSTRCPCVNNAKACKHCHLLWESTSRVSHPNECLPFTARQKNTLLEHIFGLPRVLTQQWLFTKNRNILQYLRFSWRFYWSFKSFGMLRYISGYLFSTLHSVKTPEDVDFQMTVCNASPELSDCCNTSRTPSVEYLLLRPQAMNFKNPTVWCCGEVLNVCLYGMCPVRKLIEVPAHRRSIRPKIKLVWSRSQ
jgi:hypothetical protein